MSTMTQRNINAAPSPFDPGKAIAMLEQLLRTQCEGYRTLLGCIASKRNAIRQANMDDITRICGEENQLLRRLGEFEKTRVELIARLTQHIDRARTAPFTLSELAGRV